MPATLKPKRTESARPRPAVVRPEASKLSEDRQAYRRAAPAGGDKKADVGAGANTNLEFVSYLRANTRLVQLVSSQLVLSQIKFQTDSLDRIFQY